MLEKVRKRVGQLKEAVDEIRSLSVYKDVAGAQVDYPVQKYLPVIEDDGLEHLRLISFNIQVGNSVGRYLHYLTRSWQHLLPYSNRIDNMDRIADVLSHFDIVALQEADGGSLRSGFVNQVKYLADRGQFSFWHQQLNRNFGMLAQHGNGVLSRIVPQSVDNHVLPSLIPGRGAMFIEYQTNTKEPLLVVMMHLSLSQRAQMNQLAYVQERVQEHEHVVVMGDLNCHAERLVEESPLKDSNLVLATDGISTFPSWAPQKGLDHILISPSLRTHAIDVLDHPISDHLPVAIDVSLPQGVKLLDRGSMVN
ncbi:endonuclease/exonuclease/phosphatase family protein [Litoribrevibacter albus]|uniref:EEP domain-containing protein n=1 Tax=Litoribrevibacter albus TaxID=1473156 RepID=A0AA37SF65_9GAMM|nr:endonuclease/exonuclease/phosphatase family protein [Litoribrevibacter albus]GLQ32974.1 EEP domain-containing protein [Litoribrevibacter albus]